MNSTIIVLWFLSSGPWPLESYGSFTECKTAQVKLNQTNTPQFNTIRNQNDYGRYLCLPAGVHPYEPQKLK